MSRLKDKDIAALLECLRNIYAIADVDTFGNRLIASVRKVLSCSGVLFGNCDLRTMQTEFVTDHPETARLPLAQIMANIPRNHQHPYWSHYLRTRDPQATKLSDFMSAPGISFQGLLYGGTSQSRRRPKSGACS